MKPITKILISSVMLLFLFTSSTCCESEDFYDAAFIIENQSDETVDVAGTYVKDLDYNLFKNRNIGYNYRLEPGNRVDMYFINSAEQEFVYFYFKTVSDDEKNGYDQISTFRLSEFEGEKAIVTFIKTAVK